jgi:exopolysaccharide biosynthesis predicted pyruvyltransferase EpsI
MKSARRRGLRPTAMPDSASGTPLDFPNLRERFDSAIAHHLDGAKEVILLDFPDHDNVGDSAIWVGEVQALRRLGVSPKYVSSYSTFSKVIVDSICTRVPILLSGGGNFGDIWPRHHNFRELIVRMFPERRIVQLPQTVEFLDRGKLSSSTAILRAHRNLHLIARDRQSLEILREAGLRCSLVPDAVFAIDSEEFALGRVPERRYVMLWRSDDEAKEDCSVFGGVVGVDWIGQPSSRDRVRFRRRARILREFQGSRSGRAAALHNWNSLAGSELRRGLLMLAGGATVATDRLHALLLATMLGRRVIAVENSYGKLGRVVDCWLDSASAPTFVGTRQEAFKLASSG